KIPQPNPRRARWNAGRFSSCSTKGGGNRDFERGGNLPAGDGMDHRTIKSNIKPQVSNLSMARCSRRKLRAARWARRVPLFRIVRSAKHSRDREHAASKCRGTHHDYAVHQTVSGRENVVRDFLASAASRLLATRTWR